MKKNHISIIASIVILLFASCSNKDEQKNKKVELTAPNEISHVVGIARIEPEKGLLYIYSNANGKIESVNAIENDVVKQNSILITLTQQTDEAELSMEKSKIASQKSAIESAEASAKSIQSDLQKAKADVELNEKLFAAKAITEQTLNDSKAKCDKLLFEYNKQLAGVNEAKNKLTEIETTIKYKSAVINDKIIKAPFNGKVLQLDVHQGDYITTGQKLGQFAPEGSLVAVTEVDELFAEKVKTGMKADIISQQNSEKIGEGEVVFVAEFLKKKSLFSDETTVEDRRVKEVKIRLKSDTKIAINNRVDCIIKLK
jgi:multidrug resistance efflux pump